jgi:hypothetical protein
MADQYRVEGKIAFKTKQVTKAQADRIAKRARAMGGTAKIKKA